MVTAVAVTSGLSSCKAGPSEPPALKPTTSVSVSSPWVPPGVRVSVTVGDAPPILAEVADTPAEHQRGLMGRTEVPRGTGMVFVFEEPVRGAFWMYQTLVPLSIVWVRGGRVVGVAEMVPCEGTDPAGCPRYAAPEAYDLAVETTGGFFTDARVQPGDPVVLAPAE